jgi:membrane associated rhomboid family serine protease
LKARTLALLLMAITLVQLVVGWGQVAYAAHLVGGLAGYLLARRWRDLFVLPS